MFCPECGKEKPDNKKFCDECGSALFKRVPTNTQQKKTEKRTEFSPIVFLILIGILIILALYLVPIVPSYFGNSLTLSKTVELCSSPFPVIGCNESYQWMFYIGWIIGIFCIVLGVFNKKDR